MGSKKEELLRLFQTKGELYAPLMPGISIQSLLSTLGGVIARYGKGVSLGKLNAPPEIKVYLFFSDEVFRQYSPEELKEIADKVLAEVQQAVLSFPAEKRSKCKVILEYVAPAEVIHWIPSFCWPPEKSASIWADAIQELNGYTVSVRF